MYSKNDYRYYLENQLMHSDDFLAHYGVKGMKWRKHLKRAAIPKDLTYEKRVSDFGDTTYKDYRLDFDKKNDKKGNRIWSHGVGIQTRTDKSTGEKKLVAYNTRRVKLDKDGYAKVEVKKKGRFEKSRGEDGVEYSVDLTKKKDMKKVKHKKAAQKVGAGQFDVTQIARSSKASYKPRRKNVLGEYMD